MLGELRDDVQVTLTELRELAHGIYPPRLRDRGLGDALTAAAGRSRLPTSVHAEGLARYGADIETAVYFCCLEAIQNAGKHAGDDASIDIVVAERDGILEFVVADDGAGFDTAATEGSHGFVNMRDRLGAFAGQLDIDSGIGRGTSIRGRVPLPGSS
jgi:signal transduction histidine kinase